MQRIVLAIDLLRTKRDLARDVNRTRANVYGSQCLEIVSATHQTTRGSSLCIVVVLLLKTFSQHTLCQYYVTPVNPIRNSSSNYTTN